jgi:serine protease
VTVASPGNQTGRTGTAASLTVKAAGGNGTYVWSATGLPAGLTLGAGTGVISGTPTTAGTASVKVTATSGTLSASTTFTWTLTVPTPAPCTATQLLGNGGFETGTGAPWVTTPGVVSAVGQGEVPHTGSRYGWLDGYGKAHTDTATQTVSIPAACKNVTLSFWMRIDSADVSKDAHDTLTVKVDSTLLATYSNAGRGGYVQKTFNLSAYAGKTVALNFTGVENVGLPTSFVIDDLSLSASN